MGAQKDLIELYSKTALPHLANILHLNRSLMEGLADRIVQDVKGGRSLFLSGSGHSALIPLELYHRAGGPSFVIPMVADFFLPIAGPSVVRLIERTEQSFGFLFDRIRPKEEEMLWIFSQSGVHPAVVEFAIEARRRRLYVVAFTSLTHSSQLSPQHTSGKKLFEVCEWVVDLGGALGDAAVTQEGVPAVGPLSTLAGVFLSHSILCSALIQLERSGIRCVYASVNTPDGGLRNRDLEIQAGARDPLVR